MTRPEQAAARYERARAAHVAALARWEATPADRRTARQERALAAAGIRRQRAAHAVELWSVPGPLGAANRAAARAGERLQRATTAIDDARALPVDAPGRRERIEAAGADLDRAWKAYSRALARRGAAVAAAERAAQ